MAVRPGYDPAMRDGAPPVDAPRGHTARSERKLQERLARARGSVLVRRAQLIVAEAAGRKVRRRRRQLAEAILEVARAESSLLEAGLAVPPEPPLEIALEAGPEAGSVSARVSGASGSTPEGEAPARAPAAAPAPVVGPAPRSPGEDSPVRAAARRAAREAAEALVGPVAPLSGVAGSLAGAPTVLGTIDVGANSTHLLVAVVGDHQLEPLDDQSVFLGLGEAASRGWLGEELRSALVEALEGYVSTARRLGAESVTVIGTEPLRRVSDAARVVAAVGQRTGAPLHVLSHEEEARLTLIGATMGRPVVHDLLVVDIGGGSTELIFAGPDGHHSAAGLRLGSARLTTSNVEHDPPLAEEVERLRTAAIEGLVEAPDGLPREIIAVGGTASNLVKVIPAAMLDRVITIGRLRQALDDLMHEPAETLAERHLIRPERARILAAGASIMLAIMGRYGLDRVMVSEEGLREGTLLVMAVAGARWRDDLDALATGWSSAGRGRARAIFF
jgi:exopolyphosphatase/guanosine-5'-triphosphate,3'-diphosphate pyrophosphatase